MNCFRFFFTHKARVDRALDLILFNQHQLARKLHTIMSVISDYLDQQGAHNASIDASLNAINGSVSDIVDDIAGLKAIIQKLQDSQGISAEDKALLDEALVAAAALEAKATALAGTAQAADDLTAPVVPVDPVPTV